MLKRQNTNDLNKTSAHVCGFDVVFVQYLTLSSQLPLRRSLWANECKGCP